MYGYAKVIEDDYTETTTASLFESKEDIEIVHKWVRGRGVAIIKAQNWTLWGETPKDGDLFSTTEIRISWWKYRFLIHGFGFGQIIIP